VPVEAESASKTSASLAAGEVPFIAAEKASHSLMILCRCLRVTRSGFYAWQRRPESVHTKRDRHLKVLVRASFDASKHRYGSPRIYKDLREQDERVYDNAVMEAFFSTVKSELADRFASCSEAKMELFDYIEVFYNQRRRHSTLGQIRPAEFEKRARTRRR